MATTELHPTRLALALGLLAGAAGCVAQTERPEDPADAFVRGVRIIADALVESAERRTDLSAMRLFIDELEEDLSMTLDGRTLASHEHAAVNKKLEQELMAALSNRTNLLDLGLDLEPDRMSHPRSGAELRELAEEYGATHAVVGSYVRQGENLLLSIRIVEVKTLLIVASARGVVPCHLFDPDSHTAAAAPEHPPIAVPLATLTAPAAVVAPSTARLGRGITIYPEAGGELALPAERAVEPTAVLGEGAQVAAVTGASPPPVEPPTATPVGKAESKAPVATGPAGLAQANLAAAMEVAALEQLQRVDGPAALRLRARQQLASGKD